MLASQGNTVGLDAQPGLVLVGGNLHGGPAELLGAGGELGAVDHLAVVATTRDVRGCKALALVEGEVCDEVVVAGYLGTDVWIGLHVLGDGTGIVCIQPEDESIEGVLGEVGGLSVAHGAFAHVYDVAVEVGGEEASHAGDVGCGLVADHRRYGSSGLEILAAVRPDAGRGTLAEAHEAIVVGLGGRQVGETDSEGA